MSTKQTLSDEIAGVLRDGKVASKIIATLLERVGTEIERLEGVSAEKNKAALDPLLTSADMREMRQAAEDAAFEVERLKVARETLEARQAETEEAERLANREARYRKALERRDAVAKRIGEVYPRLQAELTALIDDILSVNCEINAVNADLPDGEEHIEKAEGHARGFGQVKRDYSRTYDPPLIVEMMVPDMQSLTHPAWPPTWNGHASDKRLHNHEAEELAGRIVRLDPKQVRAKSLTPASGAIQKGDAA